MMLSCCPIATESTVGSSFDRSQFALRIEKQRTNDLPLCLARLFREKPLKKRDVLLLDETLHGFAPKDAAASDAISPLE